MSALETPPISRPSDQLAYDALAKAGADEGTYKLDVLVKGVHCAGCIQKIESALLEDPKISAARLNFTTGRLHIEWTGEAKLANEWAQKVEKLGYGVAPYDEAAAQLSLSEEEKFLLLCLGVAGFGVGNLMLISVGLWSAGKDIMGPATHDLMNWISALIALPVVIFAGRPFFGSAWGALKGGHTNMDVPISVALILACAMSLHEVFRHGEHVYFDSAMMLMFFLLIGRYLDFKARKNARGAATDLLSSLTGFAMVYDEKSEKTAPVPIRDLRPGMVVLVGAGEKVPVDGDVLEGISEIDTALVTGESLPRRTEEGAQVFAGTLNLSAPLKIRVAKPAEDSLLSDIVRLMDKAGQSQAKYVRVADRAASIYTPSVHILALSAFLFWWLIEASSWQDSLLVAVTVLIITCPCALGLAVPVVQVKASSLLLKIGVLVKSGDAFERLSTIDTILIDKTGTLTTGKPVITGHYADQDLKIAASIAQYSRHPLAGAIVDHYNGSLHRLTDIHEEKGQGLSGMLDGRLIKLGQAAWCGADRKERPESTQIWMKDGDQEPVVFCFEDQPKKDATQTVRLLKAMGIDIILISGDHKKIVDKTAHDCEIETTYGEQSPADKFKIMEEYKAKGRKVLMIGDGLNDAPVLAGADISMAPGQAIDMAANAADIIFMGDTLSPIVRTIDIARKTQRLVKQNFALAIAYNVIAVPMAFMGLVTPLVAALSMSASSLLVIGNAMRLR